MPINYNGNGNIWNAGVAIGLLPSRSYEQARQDRQADLQYSAALGDLYTQQLMEKQNFQAAMNQKFAGLQNLDIQEPDQNRINILVNDMRKNISDKILNKYDGDLRKYMMYEGTSDIEEYTNKILTNPLMQEANNNKSAMGLYSLDQKEGKNFVRDVSYKLIDGTDKTASFGEALKDYFEYKTTSLPYNGAFEKPVGAMDFFTSNIHPDPQKRYGLTIKDESGNTIRVAPEVTEIEYMDYLMNPEKGPGLNREDALLVLQKEFPIIKGSLKWKTDNLQELQIKEKEYGLKAWKAQQDINIDYAKLNEARRANDINASRVKQENNNLNTSNLLLDIMRTRAFTGKGGVGSVLPTIGKGDAFMNTLGLQIGQKINLPIMSNNGKSGSIDLSGTNHKLISVDKNNILFLGKDAAGIEQFGMVAKIDISETDAENTGLWKNAFIDKPSKNFPNAKNTGSKDWWGLAPEDRIEVGEVIIPFTADASFRAGLDYQLKDLSSKDEKTYKGNVGIDITNYEAAQEDIANTYK